MARPKTKLKPEYKLKHRLTGAAIMVAFAVIVIPLLLKDPGIEANVATGGVLNGTKKTFKTNIEPLNLNTLKLSQTEDGPGDDDGLKPALLQTDDVVAYSEFIPESPEKEIAIDETPDPVEEEQIVDTPVEPEEPEKQLVMAPEAEPEPQPVTKRVEEAGSISGWTVRVGTFTKQKNVESVSEKLSNSGFNTNHTSVETTLGTATRVWLGPYEKKETAEKVSARLKSLIGEKGYVTKHAS